MTRGKKFGVWLGYAVSCLFSALTCCGQEFSSGSFDEKPVFLASIHTLRPFQFGSFYPGHSGGTVILTEDGLRQSTGTIVLLPLGIVSPAVFEIRMASGSMVQFIFDKQVILKEASGASVMMLPGELSRGNPFVTPSNAESGFTVTQGATLILNGLAQSPPGLYSGALHVNMVIE